MDLEKPVELIPLDIKPIENNIYYEWMDLPEKMGGMYIKIEKVAMRKAIVHACGPTCEIVEPGDKVLVSIFTGVHMFMCSKTKLTDGEHHRLCREDEVVSLYAETPEESERIDNRHRKRREEFLKQQVKQLEG